MKTNYEKKLERIFRKDGQEMIQTNRRSNISKSSVRFARKKEEGEKGKQGSNVLIV